MFWVAQGETNHKWKKVKEKAVCGSYSTATLWHIVRLLERVPSLISRDAAKSVIHVNY
jgi:hypothetical protein